MNDIFKELLEKTEGYAPEQKADLQSMAETLTAIGMLSTADLQQEVQDTLEHLPELRKERAAHLRENAVGLTGKDKERIEKDAVRLEKSAEKLVGPEVPEQFRNRAALTELSFRLKAKIAGVDQMLPELDPVRLGKFDKAMHHLESALPATLSHADRHQVALYALATEIKNAPNRDFDQAVDSFYRNVVSKEHAESGHKNDARINELSESYIDKLIPEALHPGGSIKGTLEPSAAELQRQQQLQKIASNLPKLAAEYLKPQQYAAYRVMIDNEHLVNWKIEKDGKLHYRAVTLNKDDPENTIPKMLQRDLEYPNLRNAQLLVENTVKKLSQLVREHGTEDIKLSPKAEERMKKTTSEVLADPASKSLTSQKKGKGVGI